MALLQSKSEADRLARQLVALEQLLDLELPEALGLAPLAHLAHVVAGHEVL